MTLAPPPHRRRVLSDYWALIALAASLLLLGAAHAFEAMGYPPCDLCLRQREIYWMAAGVALVGAVVGPRRLGLRFGMGICAFLFFLFLVETVVAGYHAGVEWRWWAGPTSCGGGSGHGGPVTGGSMTAVIGGQRTRFVRCDEAAWRLLGLSMAGWNAIAALALTISSFYATIRARQPDGA